MPPGDFEAVLSDRASRWLADARQAGAAKRLSMPFGAGPQITLPGDAFDTRSSAFTSPYPVDLQHALDVLRDA